MNIERKLQRLHALRLQRDHLMKEIAFFEADIADEIHDKSNMRVGKRKRVKAVFVETPPAKHEQDLGSWARRLADVGDL